MAVKKKKAQKKTSARRPAKTATISRSRSQKVIDEMLVKISPALQGKINHLVSVLENSREGKLGDLSFLAGKILLRAQDVSRSLKALRKNKK